jgi:S-(hydroxymethyl)glutathione dehydrogenase/alcohol dehydrogenase
VVVPDEVPLDVMALTGCGVLTGVGTVFNGPRPDPGGSAVVIGCGGVGLNIIQALRLVGVGTIIAIDNNATRLDGASDFGATHLFNSGVTDILDAVRSVVPAGVDVAYEVVGAPALTETAWAATAPGGTCVMVGAAPPGPSISVDSRELLLTQRNLTAVLMGGASAHTEIPRIIRLYQAGQIKLNELVGERLPLDEFARAIADTESGTVARALLMMGA